MIKPPPDPGSIIDFTEVIEYSSHGKSAHLTERPRKVALIKRLFRLLKDTFFEPEV